MKFWKDLACTIPAQDGDKVAAMTPEKGEMFYQPDFEKRHVVFAGVRMIGDPIVLKHAATQDEIVKYESEIKTRMQQESNNE